MKELVFKGEEIKQLDTLLGEVPSKWGFQIINFINIVAQRRAQEEAAANADKEKTPISEAGAPASETV